MKGWKKAVLGRPRDLERKRRKLWERERDTVWVLLWRWMSVF
jgi:hypothetical protein